MYHLKKEKPNFIQNYREFCSNIVFKYFPDYEKAGILHCLKVIRLLTDLINISLMFSSCIGSKWWISDTETIGLWQTCALDGSNTCLDYNEEELNFTEKSVRILIALACCCMLATVLLSTFGIFTSRSHGIFHSISTISATICMFLALVLFTLTTASDGIGVYGWSYIVGWTSVVLLSWCFIYCTISAFSDG